MVLLHLLVSLVHGWAHGTAGVGGERSFDGLFVLIVIFAGPLVGLAWMWKNAVAGVGELEFVSLDDAGGLLLFSPS